MRPTLAIPVLTLALVSGCGSSHAGAKDAFLRGVEQIRATHGEQKLHGQLADTITRLRTAHVSTPAERRGKLLALRGFTWTLKGLEARIEITVNDSGNLEASVHDAARADRDARTGAEFLRAAGRAFGVRLGKLNGF